MFLLIIVFKIVCVVFICMWVFVKWVKRKSDVRDMLLLGKKRRKFNRLFVEFF